MTALKIIFQRAVLFNLILAIMTFQVNSQSVPKADRIATAAGETEITFIGHGSLMFAMDGKTIYIDPVKSSGSYTGLPKADLILVTHEHYDHLDPDLIKELRTGSTMILCNGAAAAKIQGSAVMKAGDRKSFGAIEIEAVPAYNLVNMKAPGQPFHPKGSGVGYILAWGGNKFYIAGDTENTPEMKALKNIDVAFLPMNLPYTMTPEMVADAARAFKPGILYPYHFGDTDTRKIVDLLKGSGIEVRIRDLK
jgi:L-ascorbate metabolism protein UlaG (beta-lactamase superfamily)